MISTVTHYSLSDEATMERLRSTLERWRQINDGHHNEKRKVLRRPFISQPFVAIHIGDEEVVAFHAWSRDISELGVCLLMPRELAPVMNDDRARIVDLSDVIHVGREFAIGLPTSPGEADPIWLRGQIKRLRPFHDVALECGVEFVDRVRNA
jgi:hypothetical protein